MAVSELVKDVVVIGGGSAGMSAGLWCADLGIDAVLVENSPHLGGQLDWIHNEVRNYPGRVFANGEEVRAAFEESIAEARFNRRLGQQVVEIDCERNTVLLDDKKLISARAIVVATGVRRRSLGVPGEVELLGKGILESGTKRRDVAAGKRVAVVGGGDAALENALILAEVAERVYLLHRRESFRGRSEFVERVRNHPKIEIRLNSTVDRFVGDTRLEAIHIRHSDQTEELPIDHAIVRIGVKPNSEIADGLKKDGQGYIIVDVQCRTSASGIWAVGEVANPVSPTIATAVGMGATCAKSIEQFLREIE